MLNRLRVKLTILYLSLAVILAFVVGGGTLILVRYYLNTNDDQALMVKMGLQFASLNLPVPVDLYQAVQKAGLVITQTPSPSDTPESDLEDGEEEDEGETEAEEENELYEHNLHVSEYADIYVLPLTREGTVVAGFTSQQTIVPVNAPALQAAIERGYDFRTIKTADGVPVRLLTYRIPATDGIEAFQVGRFLASQQELLRQLLNAMIILGGIFTVGVGITSWFLAGQTIKPAQQAWNNQQTFIANASHELRTPLTLIHAGVEVGLRHAESDQQKQLLSDVLNDADYMKVLIEDLLLLSRIDAHALKLEIKPVDLAEFLPDTLRQVERLALQNRIVLEQDIQPTVLQADPVRLKQVLLIILDNAIRNNHPEGWVKLTAAVEKGRAAITISDSGKGIPEKHLNHVFDRFFKVDDRSSSDYRGSGLGLSIARGLIEAQKGSITVHSVEGKGTQVTIHLPAPASVPDR